MPPLTKIRELLEEDLSAPTYPDHALELLWAFVCQIAAIDYEIYLHTRIDLHHERSSYIYTRFHRRTAGEGF